MTWRRFSDGSMVLDDVARLVPVSRGTFVEVYGVILGTVDLSMPKACAMVEQLHGLITGANARPIATSSNPDAERLALDVLAAMFGPP
jgi:hypothetical protein